MGPPPVMLYGFKLHLVANERGELLACQLTPGNIENSRPVPALAKRLFGKLVGDKGYISQKLLAQLFDTCGVHLLTFAHSNMQGRLLYYATPSCYAYEPLWKRFTTS